MKTAAQAPRPWIALVDPEKGTAFSLAYLEDCTRRAKVSVPRSPVRSGHLAHAFEVQSSVTMCHHLAGVRVRAGKGRCPEGRIEVRVGGTRVLWGKLPAFVEDRDPSDYAWKASMDLFWAVEMTPGNEADGKRKLGFMLPIGSKVEVWVEVEPQEEPLAIEVDLLMYLYDAGKKEPGRK